MKSLINYALLKEQLKRFWAIAALTLLAYILFIIFPTFQINQHEQYWLLNQLVDILTMRNPIIIISSVLVPLVTVLVTFSYLFQAKSTTTMHAYPINKKQLFFTNIAAGFILIVIPLLILCVVLLIPAEFINYNDFNNANVPYYGSNPYLPIELFPNGINDGGIINTFPIVAGFFLRTLLTFAFYYAVFLVAAFVTGNAIIYVLVSGVLPFIPSALLLLTQIIGYFYCFGFETHSVSKWLEQLFIYTNPVLFGALFNFNYSNNNDSLIEATNFTPYILSYVLITAVLFAISYWCNRMRKQERASDSVVFNSLKNVFIFLLSLLGMITLGAFFLQIFDSVVFMYIGFAVGFIITYFIAQMIAEKSFNIFLMKAKDLIKFSSVAIGLFLIIFVITKFDLIGYSTYTPKTDDVSGVYLNYNYFYETDVENNKDKYFLTDPEIIADAVAIHNEIVDNRDELRNVFLQNMTGQGYGNYGVISQPFVFKLKSGKIVVRQYELPQPFVEKSKLDTLLLKDEVILSPYLSFKSPEIINKIEVNYNEKPDTSAETISIDDPVQIVDFLEELKKDIIISDLENARKSKEAYEKSQNNDNDYFVDTPEKVEAFIPIIDGYVELKNELKRTNNDHFYLERFDNMKKWLIDKGYIK